MSRATVVPMVLSASIIALALLADATGFGAQTATLALVLLPLNRLRRAHLTIEPGLERYLTTGHHTTADPTLTLGWSQPQWPPYTV